MRLRLPPPHRVAGLLVALAVGMSPARVGAQTPEDGAEDAVEAPPRRRVAVLILAAGGGVDPSMADGLSELLVGALAARGGVTIVGKEEFQAQLGQSDDANTLECISSMACLGRVGVQLDVVEVVSGTLAQRDARWVFNLNRVDVPRGEIVGRVFREVEGDLGAVADALNAAIPELYAPPAPPEPEVPPAPAAPELGALHLATPVDGAEVAIDGGLVGRTRAGGLRHELPPGPVSVRVAARGYHVWTRSVRVLAGRELRLEVDLEDAFDEQIHPVVWIGGGVAIASLGAAIALGILSQESFDVTDAQRASGDVRRADLVAFYDARMREAIAADVLFGVAGGAAIAAVVALFFPERSRATRAVSLRPASSGLGIEGTF